MDVLNLYAGIGGNRKLWTDCDVTAVEWDEETAKVYQDYFPNDKVIVGDAHQYLLDHYKEFDFIWSSPPCPTHSRARFWASKGGVLEPKYPDMKLYQEILLLDNYARCKWVVENVTPFYNPMIPAQKVGRHLFWSDFKIGVFKDVEFEKDNLKKLEKEYGFKVSGPKRRKMLRNCVHPEIGEYIFNCAKEIYLKSNVAQTSMF